MSRVRQGGRYSSKRLLSRATRDAYYDSVRSAVVILIIIRVVFSCIIRHEHRTRD